MRQSQGVQLALREAAGVTSDIWFPGDVHGGSEAHAFLERVRELAPDALGVRVQPHHTSALAYGCLITVEVPDVPKSEWPVHTHLLQVMWDRDHLGGYWGCSHLWDDYDESHPSALNVTERLTPEQAAGRAIAWLAEQLRRPLLIQEWDRRLRSRPLRRWVLGDTGECIAGRRRPPRPGAPNRIVSLWPKDE